MDVCLLLLEDGTGFLLFETGSLALETGGDLELEDGTGTVLLEDETAGRLILEACPQPTVGAPFGGWAEAAFVRENETDLVVAVIHSLRRRRRLTVV